MIYQMFAKVQVSTGIDLIINNITYRKKLSFLVYGSMSLINHLNDGRVIAIYAARLVPTFYQLIVFSDVLRR